MRRCDTLKFIDIDNIRVIIVACKKLTVRLMDGTVL